MKEKGLSVRVLFYAHRCKVRKKELPEKEPKGQKR